MGLKREEAQLIREIKAEAKKNNTAGAKAMAKSLVRLRGQMTKLLAAKGQLKGVQTQITVRRLHAMSCCCYTLTSDKLHGWAGCSACHSCWEHHV